MAGSQDVKRLKRPKYWQWRHRISGNVKFHFSPCFGEAKIRSTGNLEVSTEVNVFRDGAQIPVELPKLVGIQRPLSQAQILVEENRGAVRTGVLRCSLGPGREKKILFQS